MRTAGNSTRIGFDERALRLTVEALLSNARRRQVSVARLTRRPSRFATLSPVDVLAVSLADGETITLFVKENGHEQSDHPDKQCSDREARVYEHFLRHERLPVVRYYGSRCQAAGARRAVFLEYLDAWSLRYHDLAHWVTAVRQLARLHAHFAGQAERLSKCGFLLQLDTAYFRAWGRRANAAAAACDASLGERLKAVVQANDTIAPTLSAAPATLVHNDLSPKNVLADPSADPVRVAFVDWELAGIGCGLLDLAHLLYGLDGDDEQAMCDAYLDEWSLTAPATDRRHLRRLLVACQLQKVLYRLARWQAWGLPAGRVAQWVGEAERLVVRAGAGLCGDTMGRAAGEGAGV